MNLREDIDQPIFRIVGEAADKLGLRTYIIGGYVRDIFLKRPSSDVDFVCVGSGKLLAEEVARRLGKGARLSVFANYGTVKLAYRDYELEFVGARRESYRSDSRNPIVEDGTLADDQARRDFTVNILALGLNKDNFGELVDPYNGLIDLHNKILRTPGDPDVTFSDDPLRMMRAIRFAAQLDFTIESKTFDAIRRNRSRISIIAKERINDELTKILACRRPSTGFNLLDESGLLELIMPELAALKGVETKEGKGHKDNFRHTLQVVDNVAAISDFLPLRWAALFHDIAKPVTKEYINGVGWTFRNHNFIGEKMVEKIFRRMKLPLNEKMKFVAKMVGMHMRPQQIGEEGVTDSAVRRMMTDAGDPDDLADLMILAEADLTSKNPAKVHRILESYAKVRRRLEQISHDDSLRNEPTVINGHDIMTTFNIPASSLLGDIKSEVNTAAKERNFDSTEAFDYMISIAAEKGVLPAGDVDQLRRDFEGRAAERAAKAEEARRLAAETKAHRDSVLGRI